MTQPGTSNDFIERQSESPLWAKDSSQLLGNYSKHLSNERIGIELAQIVIEQKMQPIEEAVEALQETRTALVFLEKNDSKEAQLALQRTNERLDRVISNHPHILLVPISFTMGIIDMYADDVTLKRFINEIKDLLVEGRFQRARLLLRDFASEIDIMTEYLPIANYSGSIRSASIMLEQGEIQAAKTQLLSALDTLVKTEWPIPLPVVRAQALVEEVIRQVSENKINKEQAIQLMDDADQQLSFCEKLGYGRLSEDFSESCRFIKDVKVAISQDQESKESLSKLKNSLQLLRENSLKSHSIEKELEKVKS